MTAGTPERREWLRRQPGVRRVMDSRTTEFAAQILAETGGEGVHVVLNSLAGEGMRKSLEAVARWRYQPTLLNGQPVEVTTDISVNFEIEH